MCFLRCAGLFGTDASFGPNTFEIFPLGILVIRHISGVFPGGGGMKSTERKYGENTFPFTTEMSGRVCRF